MRSTFAGLELGRGTIPDETTILSFWHLLERHELTKVIFVAIAEFLETRGALLRGGTIIDTTLAGAQVFASLALASLFVAQDTCDRLTKSPVACRPRQV
jgi:hypothetical protein